jgi:hypothetical protein
MMSRNCFGLFAAVLAAAAVSSAHAQSVIVIGDFEVANNTPNPDGWEGQNGAVATGFQNANASTAGTGAMSVVTGTNFVWALQLNNDDRATLGADLISHPILKMDVTWQGYAAQWPDSTPADPNDNWAKWEKIAINDNTGWQEVALLAAGDPVNPAFPGSWDSTNFADPHTRTLTYDTRTAIGGAPMAIDPAGFIQLWIATNMSNTAFPNGARFWVDNIRLEQIPEPSALALVSMGGVMALVRRRRRAA